MKKSILKNYLVYSLLFGILMGVVFRLVTPLFVTFKSSLLDIIFSFMCIAAGICVGFISYLIGKVTLIKTILKVKTYAQELSVGIFYNSLSIESNDEIGELVQSLNQMVERLREVIINIHSGAEEIALASEYVNSNAQRLSYGANAQATAAESVSSSMVQIAENIQMNSDNAVQAQKISLNGKRSMGLMEQTTLKSTHLFNEITRKVVIISDIAFQTNILALNSAVEASHAGEQGKGFAVISAEVRKLAERSKMASEEIASLSNKSIIITDESDKLLRELRPEIEKTAALVQEIASASKEQNVGVDQVNQSLIQLNQVIQQNAEASTELAVHSKEFATKAENLKEVIAFFKVELVGK